MNKVSDYTINEILAAAGTETKKEGNQVVCRCPVCKRDNDLKNHNCKVNEDANNIFCFTDRRAYSRTELIQELDLYDRLNIERYDENKRFRDRDDTTENQEVQEVASGLPDKSEKKDIDIKKEIIKETIYSFKNLAGETLYHKIRKDFSDKTKDIRYPDKPPMQGLVFYGLETLADADDLNYILFTEGEKCCESLRNALKDTEYANDTAVLSYNNASEYKNIGKEAQEIILSKNVIVFVDNDEAGRLKANGLCGILKNSKSIGMVDFFDKTEGYDIADWLEEGNKIDDDELKKYMVNYKPEPEPDFSQFLINNLIKNIKPIIETSVMSIKIQYQAIMGICGATSAGKTDFVLQVADEHAGLENSISLYLYYEGLQNEIAIRSEKKKMKNGDNVFAMNSITDFNLIRKFIEHYKNNKILIITDYVQALAWNLYLADKHKNKSSILREYMTQIFIEQNKLRVEFENVCFLNNYILSNDGMKEMRQQLSVDPSIALGSAKEDGNVAFQLDYAYTILFADEDEENEWGHKVWKLGRYNKDKKIKKYIQLATAKASRVGMECGNPVFVWNDGRYERYEEDDYGASGKEKVNIFEKYRYNKENDGINNDTEVQNDEEEYDFS